MAQEGNGAPVYYKAGAEYEVLGTFGPTGAPTWAFVSEPEAVRAALIAARSM